MRNAIAQVRRWGLAEGLRLAVVSPVVRLPFGWLFLTSSCEECGERRCLFFLWRDFRRTIFRVRWFAKPTIEEMRVRTGRA